MVDIPAEYSGREHSYIKHLFLKHYLEAAGYIILQGRSNIFNYVDAFAGPWGDQGEGHSDTSFALALRQLEEVRATLGRSGRGGLKIRFCFCEKSPASYEKLKRFAESNNRFDIKVFPGAFEDNLDAISTELTSGFTFTFIDPKGWNVDSGRIFSFLQQQDGDFLINFMSNPINRHSGYSAVSESFGRFLADPLWKDEYNKLPAELGNEERVLKLLRNKLQATGTARYTPEFPIQKTLANRHQMRLVLGTNSNRALRLFRDVQGKIEKIAVEARIQVKSEAIGQPSLFAASELASIDLSASGMDSSKTAEEAEALIQVILADKGTCKFDGLADIILEEISIRETKLKDLLNSMKTKRLVDFSLPPNKKKPQAETLISLHSREKF